MDKKAKQAIIGSTIVILILAIALIVTLVKKYTPNKEYMELTEYYTVPDGEAMVILDDAVYEKNAKVIDGTIYIDLDTVTDHFNHRFYWDGVENYLIYTTPTEVIKTEVGSKDYYVNKMKNSLNYVTVKTIGDQVYVALDFVEMYSDMTFVYYEEPNRVMITCKYGDYLFVDVVKNAQIRNGASIKSEILSDVNTGDKLYIIDNGGTGENGFLKVMTKDGVRGYVQKKQVSDSYYEAVISEKEFPEYTNLSKEYTINMVWHQVTNMEANQNLSSLLENTKNVTTISPTWFRVSSVDGSLTSLLSESYIEKAHSLGLEVWALVDNFDSSVDSYELLSRTSYRERLVNEIISQAIKYSLDGINIDFENLTQETGPHFIQFLRELSVKCRTNQIILSVDNYIPAPYNKFYDREEQGKIVDYVVIMGYDEHHSASEEAGSVSSMGFFNDAINNTLAMVPADKVIMGIPFYTRLWKEYVETGENKLTSEARGMSAIESLLEKNDVIPEWDEKTSQHYAEFEKDGATYKVWLENEESIEARMKSIYEANLAGVASWRLGFEKASIWNVIQKYVN